MDNFIPTWICKFLYDNVIAIRSIGIRYVVNKWLFYSPARSGEPA